MGVSMTLHEELRFNDSTITSSDWMSYPIATMAELPEIKVVLHHHPEVGSYSQGSEAANALAAPAIAAAFFDATGKIAPPPSLKARLRQRPSKGLKARKCIGINGLAVRIHPGSGVRLRRNPHR